MKYIFIATIFAILIIASNSATASTPAENADYVPGQLIIKFKGPPLSLLGMPAMEISQLFPDKNQGIAKDIGLDRIYLVNVDKGTDILQLSKELKNNPSLEYAEPNYIYKTALMPTDPDFWRQWNLHNTGSFSGSTPDADIDAPEAFDISTGSFNVKIAVLDTGVYMQHEDLQANIWINPGEIPGNGIDDDHNGKIDDVNGWDFVANASGCYSQEDCSTEDNDPSDADGHGTQVSGVAAAKMNNGKGLAGVCPNCKIIPIRVCFLTTSLTGACYGTYIASGIIYSTDLGANILSMSFGYTSPVSIITDALAYASANNKILIAAAGNDAGSAPRYPAADAGVIAVAATNWNDQRADYSNYGSWIDVAAPGGALGDPMGRGLIFTTQHSVYSMGNYTYTDGTSFSAPHVAGEAGLILSRYPNLTKDQTDHIIINSVDIITPDHPIGSGRINAYKAMNNWRCSDSTPLKQCSATRPLFCDFDTSFNLVSTEQCQQCGCPLGLVCDPSGSCYGNGGGSPLIMKAATQMNGFI